MEVKKLVSDEEILGSFDLMSELISIGDESYFLSLVRKKELCGYSLFGLFDDGLVSLIGVTFSYYFSSGKILVINDFVTNKNKRGKGYGGFLFDWIEDFAKKSGCVEIRLDSSVKRSQAHEFYKNKGMSLVGYEFCKKL